MTDRLMRALECPYAPRAGPSHRPHSAASRSVPVRFRPSRRGSRAAQRVSRNQRQPGAAGSERRPLIRAAKAKGCKFVISTDAHHPKHLANMRYGVRMARRGWLEAARHFEHAAARRIRADHSKRHNETHFLRQKSVHTPIFHRDAGSRDRSGRVRNQARHRAASRLGRDDAGGRSRSAFCWCASIACPRASICGSCPPAAWIEGETPLQSRQTRTGGRDRISRAKTWKKIAEFYPSPGFLAEKMTIYLATGLTSGEAKPMEDERIETRWFSPREIAEWIKARKDQGRENHHRLQPL